MEALQPSARLFDDEEVAERFLSHYATLRGEVRSQVVRAHLAAAIEDLDGPLKVADVGCGDGRDALWLAEQGHEVVGLDTSEAMLVRAGERLSDQVDMTLMLGDISTALTTFGGGTFDLVLSHGVLMYQDDDASFLAGHLELLRPGGLLSVLTKNGSALAYRAASEGQLQDALRLLDDNSSIGHLGLETRAHSIDEVADLLAACGGSILSWAGVRIFSDSQSIDGDVADTQTLIELESRASVRDPYRSTAALIHAIATKGVDMTAIEKFV